jgi:cardiolipin synthase
MTLNSNTVRTFAGLVVFVAICIGLIRVLETDPVQSWFHDSDSSLPAVAETALADSEAANRPSDQEPIRALIVLPDDGREAILDEFSAASISIDLYIYLLPSDEAIEALHAAHGRGVQVRVILERDPFGGGNSNQDAFDRLEAAGIEVRWANDRFRFSHIKSFIVDGAIAGIMTLNLSWTALTANREFAVVTSDPEDVGTLSALFESDWTGSGFEPSGSIVTSPDNSRVVVMDLLAAADESISIYAEVLRDSEVREALIDAVDRGVSIRILIPTDPADDDVLIYRELIANGVEVHFLMNAYSHAKAIVVDGRVALVGSQNLTSTSLIENREAGILLDDPDNVGRLLAVFEADWTVSEPVLP